MKKKKPKKKEKKITVELDSDVFLRISRISKLAEVSCETVIKVFIGAELARNESKP